MECKRESREKLPGLKFAQGEREGRNGGQKYGCAGIERNESASVVAMDGEAAAKVI